MKKIIVIGFLLFSISANAQVPLTLVRNSCSVSDSARGVKTTQIPMNEIVEENNYLGDLTVSYSQFRGQKIGYAKTKSGMSFIIFGKFLYSVADATPIEMSVSRYKNALKNGDIELDLLADWSFLEYKQKRYLCITLSRPMEKAPPRAYLLDMTSNPHRLFFISSPLKH